MADNDEILCCTANVSTKGNNKDTRLTIRVSEELRDEFHVAARLRGSTAAGLLHQIMVQIVWDEKQKQPTVFEERLKQLKPDPSKEADKEPAT